MDNRNAPAVARTGEQVGATANPVPWPGQRPREPNVSKQLDRTDSPNLESKLRGMLLHTNGNPTPETTSQHTHRTPRHAQRQNSGSFRNNIPQGPAAFSQNPASPTQTGLLPSPNIQRRQHPPGLPRSNTHPAQGYAPHQPPGMDRASSFHEATPGSQFGHHFGPRGSHHSPRSQRAGYGYRQNGYRNQPVPQMNNALHFPPLGTTPPAAPLSDHPVSPNLTVDTVQRHHTYGHGSAQTERHHSPTYHKNPSYFDSTRQSPEYTNTSPQSRRGRPYHSQRGSYGGRSRRNYAPSDYSSITDYVRQIVHDVKPTADEISIKGALLSRISKVCETLVPGSRIIPFGSLVSGFATRGADMDLIFVHDTMDPPPSSQESNIPIRLAGEFLKRGFEVDLLIKTRVPILKLKTPGSKSHKAVQYGGESWPENVSCDIGFKAHLGITNSHFFRTYSECDPRFAEMVLFIKQWSKNRDLNSPYFGTLSSYGYVLMVAHFLINVVQPPILPNLQLIPPKPGTPESELTQDGYNIWYFKDVDKIHSGELLPGGKNEMSLGQLVYEFFQYYTTNFNFVGEVVTIRTAGGVMYKQQKGWTSAKMQIGELNTTYQDRYLLALEDPFEVSHNVGRTCSTTGVRRIRNEMQRAAHMLRTLCMQHDNLAPARTPGWDAEMTIYDLMVEVRQNNHGFRNRKNNQKKLEEWIKYEWTVGRCLAQIDAAAEDLRRKRELGLPDDAELPPESDEGSEEGEEEEDESDTDSTDSAALPMVISSKSTKKESDMTALKLEDMKIS